MRVWPVQDAKARFSEMLDTCLKDGPQMVTRRGIQSAVLVPIEEWQEKEKTNRPNLKELLLSSIGKGELNIPKRGSWKMRPSPELE